jgi:putative ABC transport system ATP-binding protein
VVSTTDVHRTYTRGTQGGLLRRNRSVTTVRALDGVSVSVTQGELVGIAGPSGSGKSTLLHLMAALDAPTSGRVEVRGTDTSELSDRERSALRRDHIGIVFQRFHLLSSLTAQQNVALPFIEWGVGKQERRERAARLLHQVGLGDRLDHRPAELSGGEQQRVAVARALAGKPDLLIADEPTGELDSEAGATVLDLLESLSETRAVVVASHDQAVLERVDRVIRLRDGTVVSDA